MRTLYLRNVPDDVVDRLERLAERDGTSVSAVAIRGLTDISWRAEVEVVLDALPDWQIPTETIVAAVRADRDEH